jgi:hypothetical protein
VRGGGGGGGVQGRDPPGGGAGGGGRGQRPSSEGEPPPDEFIETLWTYPGSLCCAASAITHLPDSRIPLPDDPRGPGLAEGTYNLGKNAENVYVLVHLSCQSHYILTFENFCLVTSVSRVMMEQGPRLVQQDVALCEPLHGLTPMAVIHIYMFIYVQYNIYIYICIYTYI